MRPFTYLLHVPEFLSCVFQRFCDGYMSGPKRVKAGHLEWFLLSGTCCYSETLTCFGGVGGAPMNKGRMKEWLKSSPGG